MICVDNQHQYGLWSIDKQTNVAFRSCENCGFHEEFKATEEYHQEVKKQKEAELFFKAFQMVENHDEHIIGYLNLILDDYVNYLEKDSLNLLITKMEALSTSDKLDVQNALFVNQLQKFLRLNNVEAFQEGLEQFQNYNAPYLNGALTNEGNINRHL